jgi:hypothetical protein
MASLYEGLTAPTLMGLPVEVGTEIGRRMGQDTLAAMQRVSKRARLMTEPALLDLYNTLPSSAEIADYVYTVSESYGDEIVAFYRPSNDNPCATVACTDNDYRATYHAVTRYSIGERYDGIPVVSRDSTRMEPIVAAYEREPASSLPCPSAVMECLRRRAGCRKRHLERHGVDEYGVDLVRNYIRATFRPYLAPLVKGDVDAAYAAGPDVIGSLLVDPASEPDLMRMTYRLALERLRMLTSCWLDPMRRWDEYYAPDDDGEMRQHAVDTVSYVVGFDVGMLTRRADARVWLPDDREIVGWLRKALDTHTAFRMRLWDRYGVCTTIDNTSDGRVQYSALGCIEDADGLFVGVEQVPVSRTATLASVLATGSLPGRVDPDTMLKVMRERVEARVSSSYGVDAIRQHVYDGMVSRLKGRILYERAYEGGPETLVAWGHFWYLQRPVYGTPAVRAYVDELVRTVLHVWVWMRDEVPAWLVRPDWTEDREDVLRERAADAVRLAERAYADLQAP